ncbi:MAG TPA: metallophosphoesterase family protein [Bryobacteraceae bacterium]|nr:metallophosphoesterase family protein [Bryobacteraceae bacterium]
MRYLILSDLHSNWEALQAVLQDAGGRYDRALCCGDLVGYGADPNAIVTWVREHCDPVVRGNHDKACTGLDDLEWFNPVARAAAIWTHHNLTPDNAEYTRGLPKGPILEDGFQIVHGSPFDEDEYVLAADEAMQAFSYLECRLAFFGHTHVQGGFIWNRSRVETILNPSAWGDREELEIDPECAYMINPGSVGQPRDGNPRSAYALYDSESKIVTYCRTDYDLTTAQKKIREAGLPPILADRLAVGR